VAAITVSPATLAEYGGARSLVVESRSTRPLAIAPVEQEVIDIINGERARQGLAPLNSDPRLTEAAAIHSIDMAGGGFFAHQGSDGSGPDERVAREGYRWRYVAENIGCGQDTPQRIVSSWLGSQGHRDNMLSADATDIGVALATRHDSSCRIFWTALFADEN
jgi:uncharacterized protein YkwD